MTRNITKIKRNKTQYKTCDAQSNCSPVADQHLSSDPITPASLLLSMMFYSTDYLPLWLTRVSGSGCAPSQLLAHLLAGREKAKNP